MDWNFFVASAIGFIPSFGILYFLWGKYEGLFDEKYLFFNYFIGWIMGLFVAVFFLILASSVYYLLDLSILSMVFFALFTEMFKYVYLNRPKYRGNYRLTFYGMSIGLGMGGIWIVALSYFYLSRYPSNGFDYGVASLSFLILSTALSAIHGATGSLIGYGIYKGLQEKYLLQSFGYQILFNFTLLPFIWLFPPIYYFWGIIIAIPVLYYKVYKGVFLHTIPKKVMKKWKERKGE
jgi:hypothetical protein